MASESRMLRLLQGDVGSGKTVVALLAMLTAVEQARRPRCWRRRRFLRASTLPPSSRCWRLPGVRGAILTGRDKAAAAGSRS